MIYVKDAVFFLFAAYIKMWREKIWILKKRNRNLRWAVLTDGFSLFSFWPVTKAGKRMGHPQLVDWS